MVLLAAFSFASAYFASFGLEALRKIKGVSLRQAIAKPPLVAWGIVAAILIVLLANGLLMSYLSSRT